MYYNYCGIDQIFFNIYGNYWVELIISSFVDWLVYVMLSCDVLFFWCCFFDGSFFNDLDKVLWVGLLIIFVEIGRLKK